MNTAEGSLRQRTIAELWRPTSVKAGIAIIGFFVTVALLAPLIAPYDPLASDWLKVLTPPSAEHPLGTDDLGRDILSRLIYGAQSSMFAAFAAAIMATLMGVPIGIVAGYFGVADIVISRITDTVLAVPGIMLAMALALFLGGSLVNASVAIAIAASPALVRLARASTLQIRSELYIEAARSAGIGDGRMLFVQILPNLVPPIIVQVTLTMATAVLAEASLSFLGLGRPPPAPSWGTMLTSAKDYIHNAPWMSLWPGLCICLAMVGFSLLGEGLRQTLGKR